MFEGTWVIHEGHQGIGDSRVAGIPGLGGQTEIGEPQTGDGDLSEAGLGNCPCLFTMPVQQQGAVHHGEKAKEGKENGTGTHGLFHPLPGAH